MALRRAGAGILQVAPALLPECRPELRGWFSQPDPSSWDLDGFAYAEGARRFDAGTPAPLAAIASVLGLRWKAGQGSAALLARAQGICGMLLDGLPWLDPLSHRDPARRGGSVMFRPPEGAGAGALIGGLREEGLHADARGMILRLSPGATTTEEDVDRLCSALKRLL